MLFWWLLDLVLVVTIIVGFAWAKSLQKQSDAFINRSITVSAEGKAVAVPDIARLMFSVESQGTDPKALQDETARQMNRAIAFLKEQGVGDEDIKTTSFQLFPRYDYDRFTGRTNIFGYTLTQSVSVKIRDFAKIGAVVGSLPAKGVNRIDSFSFDVDDRDGYLSEARDEAFKKAHEKASRMARQNGVRLGKVITFSDSSDGSVPYPQYERAMGLGGGDSVPAPVVPTIEPGTSEIVVNVSVTYELR